jgi:hypothetical protein
MARAKKNEIVDKTDDERTLMDLENINPKKKNQKKLRNFVVAKEDKVEPKKDKKQNQNQKNKKI